MKNFLADAIEYGASWTESERAFLKDVAPKLFKRIKSAKIVMSQGVHNDEYDFDGSLQMALQTDKGTIYKPLSTLSELEEGDEVDVQTIVCIELTRPGDEPCYKMDGELLDKE